MSTVEYLNLNTWDGLNPVLLPLGQKTMPGIEIASIGVLVPLAIFVMAMFDFFYNIWAWNLKEGLKESATSSRQQFESISAWPPQQQSPQLYEMRGGGGQMIYNRGARQRMRLSPNCALPECTPVPQCHNIVSTSQIQTSMQNIDLQRLAGLFPFTSYDRKRFAAITIRLANPHCTCLLFGSGKLVITGSTSYHACLVASHAITEMLRKVNQRDTFEVVTCVIQNIVAHVELPKGQRIDLDALYARFCECSTYQRSIFPGLVLRPPESPIVLLIFNSGRIVCTGGKSYDDIYYGFADMYKVLQAYIIPAPATDVEEPEWTDGAILELAADLAAPAVG